VASIGLGDDVTVGRLTYSGVTIVKVADGMVTFTTRGGPQSKPFSEITGMSLKGLDAFNQAEELISQKAGASKVEALKRQVASKEDEIAKVKASTVDQSGAAKKLKESADRVREQSAAYSKSAKTLTKQLADMKKALSASQGKAAKLKSEAVKLNRQALAVERARRGKDWQARANHLKNQARQFLKMAEESDPSLIRRKATQKRLEERKLRAEAAQIARQKKKNWQGQSKNKRNEADKRKKEADSLDQQAKRLTDEMSARNTRMTKLSTEIGNLTRQSQKANLEAKSLDSQARNYPKYVEKQKAKVLELEVQKDELQAKLDALASGPKTRTSQYPAAIRLYKSVAGQNIPAQTKAIVDYRLLSVLDRAGWIDESTSQWMSLVDREKGSAGALACRPSTFAPKGDTRNSKAISVIQSRLSGMKDGSYKIASTELLARLLLNAGRSKEVVKLLTPPPTAELKTVKAMALLNTKEYDQAVAVATEALGELKRASLDEALFVRASAYLAQSGSVADKAAKRKLMLKSAFDFMRVAAFFEGEPRAGEALFNAGKIMASLSGPEGPNKEAASRAYQAVAGQYAGTAIGKSASDELKKLGN